MDVVEFLSERIDEDEAAARKLLKDRSVSKSGRWYEERLLRECQAKRTLIAVVEEARQAALASLVGQDPNAAPWNPEAIEWTSRALNAIALPYAEHPDYQPDWRLL
ncbi:DUF6221 family protein [Arthrobacter sp. ISL-30]|uniref:DUF6221 family protein n=1 Tax=Arthrobacter sp. ISL-30 TaxID=2819109 RepID=UPI001BE868A8|nr:DUF6221 family protein [Arthrobacter sp. ISL-30]MBT2514826.1 hypothetical protein [Arthrobacter sp. ISL-30]